MESSNSSSLNNEVSFGPTIKKYLEDSYLFEIKAKLIEVKKDEKEGFLRLVFDQTVFHPQGGGQPSDRGIIYKEGNKEVNVLSLVYDREKEIIYHIVNQNEFESSNMSINDVVSMKIDEEYRRLNARLHSGGHLLDIAVRNLGLPLVPGKGYHFEDGPYVEYNGKLDKSKSEEIREKLENESNNIIANTPDVDKSIIKLYDYEEAKTLFEVPSYLPQGKPFRWVKLSGQDEGCPCGGTHVKHIQDINKLSISKVTIKGKIVRISYKVL